MRSPFYVISKTINKTISKLNITLELGRKKCPVYLKLPCLIQEANFLKNKIKDSEKHVWCS